MWGARFCTVTHKYLNALQIGSGNGRITLALSSFVKLCRDEMVFVTDHIVLLLVY